MSRLEDLQKQIAAMTDEELRQHVYSIRKDRTTRKQREPSKATKQATNKKKVDLKALLLSMSPEERERFIREIT